MGSNCCVDYGFYGSVLKKFALKGLKGGGFSFWRNVSELSDNAYPLINRVAYGAHLVERPVENLERNQFTPFPPTHSAPSLDISDRMI